MLTTHQIKFARLLVLFGGVIAIALTLWGCLASIMLDYLIPTELSLAFVFVVPLPRFLIGLFSWRISLAALLFDFLALAYIRAFLITPNPQKNPFDVLGIAYVLPLVCLLVAYFLTPRDGRSSTRQLWKTPTGEGVTGSNDKLEG